MDRYLAEKIEALKQKNLYRQPKGEWGEGFLRFDTNDYLGLAQDSRVIAAGVVAAERFGAGGQASRVAGGNFPLYDKLEAALALAKGTEAACVFGSGYLANIGTISALMGKGDLIVMDKFAHSCLIEGAQLSGAKLVRFKHNDMAHLREILQRERGNYRKCLLVTEEYFSMDGDMGNLAGLAALKTEHNCWLMVDGAHSIYEPIVNYQQAIDVYMGTLSKALGSYGGYVCGSHTLIDYLKTSAKTLIYSTALPPFVVGAAIEALRIIDAENPSLNLPSWQEIAAKAPLIERGVGNGLASHIIPIIIGDEARALEVAEKLRKKKIIVSAIRPPTVPAGTSRLRVSLSAKHSDADLRRLKDELGDLIIF